MTPIAQTKTPDETLISLATHNGEVVITSERCGATRAWRRSKGTYTIDAIKAASAVN